MQGAKEVKQGMLAGLFRIPSKRLENGAEQSKEKEAGRVNGKTQGENGNSSPRGWVPLTGVLRVPGLGASYV